MGMSRADLEALAGAIKRASDEVYEDPHLWGALQRRAAREMHLCIVQAVAAECAKINPNFKRDTFFDACGIDFEGTFTTHGRRA